MYSYFLLITSLKQNKYKNVNDVILQLRKVGAKKVVTSNFYCNKIKNNMKNNTLYVCAKFHIDLDPIQLTEVLLRYKKVHNRKTLLSMDNGNVVELDLVWSHRIKMSTYNVKLPNISPVCSGAAFTAITEIINSELELKKVLLREKCDDGDVPVLRVSEYELRKLYGEK